jgi:hypothetical protein
MNVRSWKILQPFVFERCVPTEVIDRLEKQGANTVADSTVSVTLMDSLSISLGDKVRLDEKLLAY